ncbi:hypothetical protein [uncultured Dysosmobacter sp.]|uniref:hypothetical protein n=1 Tax=uncultured Dysosmobacter sp. TaxID=2591384 RepID=UPI00261190E0|nr:hypothetical protein [uncultured Dysosmobacter sp.]
MKKASIQRWGFLFLSFAILICAGGWKPAVYGNDEASIKRYIVQEMGRKLGDHVELLAVEDRGEDRIVVYRLETKRPDDRYVIRFRRNDGGNYEQYGRLLKGLPMYGGPGIWSEQVRPWGSDRRLYGDKKMYYVVWSESPKLEEIRVQVGNQPEQTARPVETPSLTVLEFEDPAGSFRTTSSFRDAGGNEL